MISRQVHVQSKTKSRNERTKRVRTSLTTIWNCRYEDWNDSESDYSDEKYVTDDRQILFTERQHEISFFRSIKLPQHNGRTVTKPSDLAITPLMNYRYYWYMNTSHVRLAKESNKLHGQVKTFWAMFDSIKFSGDDPIIVLHFLPRFVEKADKFGVSESHTFLIMPKLLNSRAERNLPSICNRAKNGAVTCCQEAVNHFLRTYATLGAIGNAANNLRNIRHLPREGETTYGRHINQAAHRCGNVYDETDKMTLFFEWNFAEYSNNLRPLPGIKRTSSTILPRIRTVRSWWGRISSSNSFQPSCGKHCKYEYKRSSYALHKANTPSGRYTGDDEHSYVIKDGSIPTEELLSTTGTSSSQPLMYVGSNIRRHQPIMVKPSQLAEQEGNTTASRRRWVEPKRQNISY